MKKAKYLLHDEVVFSLPGEKPLLTGVVTARLCTDSWIRYSVRYTDSAGVIRDIELFEEDILSYPTTLSCECGAIIANTTHAHWCPSFHKNFKQGEINVFRR